MASSFFSQAQNTSKDFYIQALLRTNKGQYEEAVKFFNRAIELKADYAEAFLSRGNAFFKMGNHKRAIWDYDKAIELSPDLIKAFNHRGYCYYETKDYRRAIEDFTHVINKMPDYPDVYLSRGKIHLEKGRFDVAFTDFEKAVQLDPKSHEGMYLKSLTFLGKKDTAQALSEVNNALALAESQPDYLVLRASINYANKLEKEAGKDNSSALKSDPHHIGALIQKANFIIGSGKASKACKTLEKANGLGSEEAAKLLAEYCAPEEEVPSEESSNEAPSSKKEKKTKKAKDDK